MCVAVRMAQTGDAHGSTAFQLTKLLARANRASLGRGRKPETETFTGHNTCRGTISRTHSLFKYPGLKDQHKGYSSAPLMACNATRLRALALYKELHRLGRDYPDPSFVCCLDR